MKAKSIFAIIFTILITVILMQNQDAASFKILFWDLMISKLVMLTGFIFIGILLAFMLPTGQRAERIGNDEHYEQKTFENKPHDTLSAEDRDYISD